MTDIAHLLSSPSHLIKALDLYNGLANPLMNPTADDLKKMTRVQLEEQNLRIITSHDRTTVRFTSEEERIESAQMLQDCLYAITKAEEEGNPILVQELNKQKEELYAALSGKMVLSGGQEEKARKAVTDRIKAAIKHIEKKHPSLGEHLFHSIQTGKYCRYQPETEISWVVKF